MKKRFSLLLTGILLSMLLLFAGCGEGAGAEDTGDDGKVGDRTKATTSTTSTTSTSSTTTSADQPKTASTTGGDMMDDARDLVEDIMPGGEASNVR